MLKLKLTFSFSNPLLLTTLFFLLFSHSLYSDPWGKDADLVRSSKCSTFAAAPLPQRCPTLGFGLLAEALIGFHQKIISPADGPRSHFLPSSSQYTLDAMRKYGFYKGFTMGCDRLTRENGDPWVYRTVLDPRSGKLMKSDPVP